MTTNITAILDVMSGADGGVAFVKLRTYIEQFETQAASGDAMASEILLVISRFNKLCNICLNNQ